MKKLIFLFAMVLSISMAIAQKNTSTVTQTGIGENNAAVEQIGKFNKAIVEQTNNVVEDMKNNATTYQKGVNNYARIRQINTHTAPFTNPAAVQEVNAKQEQRGNDNYADIYQEIGRWGVINAEQYQRGNDNWARITQKGAAHSNAKQTQIGDDNWANIEQNVQDYANAEILQTGYENKSLIKQHADHIGMYQTAYNHQRDYRNFSNINQSGIRNYDPREDCINTATVNQWGAPGTGGLEFVNESTVTQVGGLNNATVSQRWQ